MAWCCKNFHESNMKKILFALLFAANSAWANPTITVPTPPGGAPDAWTRVIAKFLAQEIGVEYIVVNKPAAAGRVAVEHVATQPADGQNLITVATGPFLFNKVLYNNLSHDYTAFDILAPMAQVPLSLSVSNNLGVSTLAEFLNVARSKTLNCAGSSASSVFVGKQFFNHLQVRDVQFIPFRGSADMNVQLAAGTIDCAFDTVNTALSLHKNSKYKIIAVSTESRYEEVSTAALFSSVVPGLVFYNWYGIAIKVNTPNRDQIFTALRKINQDPAFRAEIVKRGLEVVNPPANGQQWIHREYLKFEAVRKQLNIEKLD